VSVFYTRASVRVCSPAYTFAFRNKCWQSARACTTAIGLFTCITCMLYSRLKDIDETQHRQQFRETVGSGSPCSDAVHVSMRIVWKILQLLHLWKTVKVCGMKCQKTPTAAKCLPIIFAKPSATLPIKFFNTGATVQSCIKTRVFNIVLCWVKRKSRWSLLLGCDVSRESNYRIQPEQRRRARSFSIVSSCCADRNQRIRWLRVFCESFHFLLVFCVLLPAK